MFLQSDAMRQCRLLLVAVWLFVLLHSCASLKTDPPPHNATSPSKPCSCEKRSRAAHCDCAESTTVDLQSFVTESTEELFLVNTDFSKVISESASVESVNVKVFSCSNCNVTRVADVSAFLSTSLEQLDLSDNSIRHFAFDELRAFESLRVVNLSHNAISDLTPLASHLDLDTVRVLDLSHNKLTSLSRDAFNCFPNLQQLDLSSNNLSHLHPSLFARLDRLTALSLRNNYLSGISRQLIASSSLRDVRLAGNPWNCHCGLAWLAQEVTSGVVSDNVRCSQPEVVAGDLLSELDPHNLTCVEPQLQQEPSNTEGVVWHSFQLHCNATGTPAPSVYWRGPRGYLVHPDMKLFLPSDVVDYDVKQTFTGQPRFKSSEVEILRSGSLQFTRFRYNYAGEYTCFASNPLGVNNATVHVAVRSPLYTSVVWSVVFGGFVSLVFLVVSVVVGLVRILVRRVRKHLRKNNMAMDDPYEDEAEFWDEYFRHPLDTARETPDHFPSPVKCITPAEPAKSELSDVNTGISSTLESVRTRLGASMGRHMEQMRTRANHMRETGRTLRIDVNKKVERMRYKAYLMRESANVRMTNLRESSTATLRNMREGVAGRYEAVKYQVRSFREFCGTANMPHTVSVPSISTNVDSQEREEVFKTITFC